MPKPAVAKEMKVNLQDAVKPLSQNKLRKQQREAKRLATNAIDDELVKAVSLFFTTIF